MPLVPSLQKPPLNPIQRNDNVIPPEQINNFVYESEENRLVLDFGDIKLDAANNQESLQQSQLILDRLSPGEFFLELLKILPCLELVPVKFRWGLSFFWLQCYGSICFKPFILL